MTISQSLYLMNESQKSDRVDLVFRVLLETGSPKGGCGERNLQNLKFVYDCSSPRLFAFLHLHLLANSGVSLHFHYLLDGA